MLRFQVFSGTTVTFTDQDGDQATLNITNGGRSTASGPSQGPATQNTQFWILDPIALRSTLSGTVRKAPRGDGIVVIAEIIGLDKKEFTPLLTNTSFRVNTLTFSSNADGEPGRRSQWKWTVLFCERTALRTLIARVRARRSAARPGSVSGS